VAAVVVAAAAAAAAAVVAASRLGWGGAAGLDGVRCAGEQER
jgi:hypothetical protein